MDPESLIPAFVNPGSGNFEKAREALQPSGRFDIREVAGAELEERVREAVEQGASRILIAGGDGSIGTAAARIVGTECELAVVPAGTLNHFARDIGIPVELAEAVEVASGTVTTTVDIGRVSERVFLNTSSLGVYVTFVRVRDRLERWLPYRLASIVASIRAFTVFPTIRVDLEIEGKAQTFRTPLIFIGVGERELQLPKLGSRVKNGDRKLHVIAVRGRRRARLLATALEAVARGVETAAQNPELDSYLVDKCTLYLRRRRATISLDGETVVLAPPLEYRVDRDALRIVAGAPPR
ncbi:MAG TPA: diacylglycerol kinase family protein [Gemmatimonadaceae bacterium]